MEDEIVDYKPLYEAVVGELEEARLAILKMRYTRNPLDRMTGDAIRKFVTKNYMVIIVALYFLSMVPSLIHAVTPLIFKRRLP